MLRLALFNDEERVVRLALEEFIERRRKFTSTSGDARDAQHVHDRGVAREVLHDLRCTVPEPDPIGFTR